MTTLTNVRGLFTWSHRAIQGWIVVFTAAILCSRPPCCIAETQDPAPSPAVPSPSKVLLRWQFRPNQTISGKLDACIRTLDENPQETSYVWESKWLVQSLDEQGVATLKVVVNRERFKHLSAKVQVGYDSDRNASFKPSELELSEIKEIFTRTQAIHKRDYYFRVTARGQVTALHAYDEFPGQLIAWPRLPEEPVGIGDVWDASSSGTEPNVYALVDLIDVGMDKVALIEKKDDSSRYRFLVNQGRFLDKTTWNILASKPGPEKQIVQHFSSRYRLDSSRDQFDHFDLRSLQPNQPGRCLDMILQSSRRSESIKEYFVGERNELNGIQGKLFVEHVEKIDVPSDRDAWMPYDWFFFARYYQRLGDTIKYKEILSEGAKATAINSELNPLQKETNLLQFVELLTEAGEFEIAKKVFATIPIADRPSLAITSRGNLSVPRYAMRDYAMLLITKGLAKQGRFAESLSTIQMLSSRASKSAAYWIVAYEQAEYLKTKDALASATAAENLYSAETIIIEFATEGPVEVSVQTYRTLALSKIAISQAKQNDEAGMTSTLSMIKSPTDHLAGTVELITTLDKEGMKGLADKISAQATPSIRSLASELRIADRIRSGRLQEASAMLETIQDPESIAASRLAFCEVILYDDDPEGKVAKQLALAETAIEKIRDVKIQSQLERRYASILADSGRLNEARAYIEERLNKVESNKKIDMDHMAELLQTADVLFKVSRGSDFDKFLARIEMEIHALEDHLQGSYKIALLNFYLHKNLMEPAGRIASEIDEPSLRCQAFCAVGKRYAQLIEMESSREWFAKAFKCALDVPDTFGLYTMKCKGGALRYVSKQQGDCDLEGLIRFLELASDPNVIAYGWLGGAEGVDPTAAIYAGKTGRLARNMLEDTCESNVACKILQPQANLDPTLRTDRDKR